MCGLARVLFGIINKSYFVLLRSAKPFQGKYFSFLFAFCVFLYFPSIVRVIQLIEEVREKERAREKRG